MYMYGDLKVCTCTETLRYVHVRRPKCMYMYGDLKGCTCTETLRDVHVRRP